MYNYCKIEKIGELFMNFIKKVFGKIVLFFSLIISKILDFLIFITSITVNLISGVFELVLPVLLLGGCGIFFFFPVISLIFFSPLFILLFFLFIVAPIVGRKIVSLLKYGQYVIVEYLNDYGNYLIGLKNNREYTSFKGYSDKYKTMREEYQRQERENAYRQQQEQFKEQFRQWSEYFNQRYGSYTGNEQGYYGNNQGYYRSENLESEFKAEYERNCDLLEVSYNADKYEIKLAYRKMAKKYHPDINKAYDATEKFQKINQAFEFLNEDNIERYKRITKG